MLTGTYKDNPFLGAEIKAEIERLKDRVDDALHATKAAIQEGIVPGGGAALWYAREAIMYPSTTGAKIVYKACGKPFEQILVNASLAQNWVRPVVAALGFA